MRTQTLTTNPSKSEKPSTPEAPARRRFEPEQGEVLVTGYEGTEATCIPTATPTTAHRTLQRAHSHPKLKNKTSEDRRGAKKSSGPGQRGRQGSYGGGALQNLVAPLVISAELSENWPIRKNR